ncbi:MAG: hypothetical protein ACQCN5_01825 [Candidatus Bathyarchaeia archaeon]|jgi:hypothetical protein
MTSQNSNKILKNPAKNQTPLLDIPSMLKQGGKRFLFKLKQKALRSNNTWYRVLSLDKRRFIDAVIQTVDRIKSILLLKLMTELAEKLVNAIGGIPALIGSIPYGMITYGAPLAERISATAQAWGNKAAKTWVNDEVFIRYLTVIDQNNLPMFRVSTIL